MIIETNIAKYIVFAEDSLLNALRKITENKSRIIFLVTEAGRLEGVLTDGDFRRWLVEQPTIDLDQPVSRASNKNFVHALRDDDPTNIAALFSERLEFVPLLDSQHHLVAIARKRAAAIRLGGFTIDEDSPAFLVAEVGNNHNGSLDRAKQLIDRAVAAGADCVKFQMRHMDALYRNRGDPNDASEDLGSQYTLDLLSRFALDKDQLFAAFDHCRAAGTMPLCTPWDVDSVAALERYGMEAYKVASADLTNHDLIRAVAETRKPIFVSTGMSTEQEIVETTDLLKRLGGQFVLLHCNSTYPAPFKDVNLNYLQRLHDIGDCLVGYSGHERGYAVAVAAVVRGAKVIEKHFTLDMTMEGNDHKVSLLPEEFAAMVESIRQVEEAMGSGEPRQVSQGEMINRESLAKSLIAARPIAVGETIAADMLAIKSPGKGLQPNRSADLIGRRTRRPLAAGDFFYESDLGGRRAAPRDYRFRRPWGVPVRYHDFAALSAQITPSLVEFHLSYKDLEVEPERFVPDEYDVRLVVHSPELFSGDHILDLCAPDEPYRRHSVAQLQRVIDMARDLKPHFPATSRPLIITNVGGFSKDRALPVDARPHLYDNLRRSLGELDAEGVEIIPQTMPPFPWHFGGQRYHNLFVDGAEIARFCEGEGYRICLDVSHSRLACNHADWSFVEFVETVGAHIVHLHLADARGIDDEGLQIGEGEIDFANLARTLDRLAPDAGFIAEIWQGHKDSGEGFWIALDRLEKWF